MKYCPVCDTYSEEFSTFGYVPRPNAQCPNCKSLERHRFLWIILNKEINSDNLLKDKNFLHIAPEVALMKHLENKFKDNYLTADKFSKKAKIEMDITDIQYQDESFDYIYCSHVLEHIEDDFLAIKELSRVLKKGGSAFIQVPIRRNLEKTEEDLSITDKETRLKLYGHKDHVRNYGKDFIERLKTGDWEIEEIMREQIFDEKELEKMGLTSSAGEVFLCKKQKETL